MSSSFPAFRGFATLVNATDRALIYYTSVLLLPLAPSLSGASATQNNGRLQNWTCDSWECPSLAFMLTD